MREEEEVVGRRRSRYIGALGCRTEESWGSEVKNASEVAEEPLNGMGSRGVRLSEVIVTGRQKVELSELKRVKASWSSEETGGVVSGCKNRGLSMAW